jgi:EAL domain-containing protein (putative c-di-GMP-specific phosphodiesterase class I)
VRVAVNVSAHEIKTAQLVDAVEAVLRQTGLDPCLLELEITEGALQIGDGVFEVLERIRRLGVQLALDDFGAGYSSLGSIKSLPFDRIKIDRSLIQDLAQDTNNRSIVRAIIAMGRSLKLEILAEGVETPAQLEILREENCDEVQGYLLSRPMTVRDLDMRCRNRIARLPGSKLQLIAPSKR